MNYSKTADKALAMLTKYGKSVTLRALTPGAYDTATSTVTETATDETRKAAFFDFHRINYGQTLRDGSLIQQGDRQCLLDAIGAAPTLSSRIIDGATDYGIVDIKEINPAGTPILYDMLVRK